MHSGRAAELGSKGGRRRAVYSLEDLKQFDPPKSAAELRDLLAHSIVETRTGKLDPKLANSLAYLATGFLRALEVADLEKRLEMLEAEVTVREFATENSAAGKNAGPRPAGNLPA
jgi:hypothetical protein